MPTRTLAAVLAAPACAALAVSLLAWLALPSAGSEELRDMAMRFVASLVAATAFELAVLLPLWWLLRARTTGARLALGALGIGAWFALTAALGFVLGHGAGSALRFASSLLAPGVVLVVLFAALIAARADGAAPGRS
jgi:hypothetical protein